jgi:Spy/CpxP family protein refolding chaperone
MTTQTGKEQATVTKTAKRIGILALAATVITFGAGAVAFAWGGHHSHGHGHGADMAIAWMAYKLDLTDDQEKTFESLMGDVTAQKGELQKTHRQLHDAIKAQLAADTVDREALNRLVEEKKAAFDKLATFAVDTFARFHALLTPEQRAKLTTLMEEKERCGKRRMGDNDA